MHRAPSRHVIGFVSFFLAGFFGLRAQSPVGLFEDQGDIGFVSHAGSAAYNAAEHSYTVAGSGENMWLAADALHFAWKKLSGDLTLSADIAFLGTGGNAHRKAVLMIRQSLDADSAYADAAVHGSGLTSLQGRDEKGAITREVQSAMSGPARVRIAKRGAYFYLWVAGPGEELHMAGGSMRVPLDDPFYVGIGVCSHDNKVIEKAVFSKVDLATGAAEGSPTLYSTLETVPVSSGDRRVVYVAAGRLGSPEWTRDGKALLFKRGDRTERIPAAGGVPEKAGDAEAGNSPGDGKSVYFANDRSGGMQVWRTASDGSAPEQLTPTDFQNCFPHLSPDGSQLIFLSYDKNAHGIPTDQDVMLRVMSVADGKVKVVAKLIGGKGTLDLPSWSPDGRSVAFVSYQLIR